jgi:hypothetical protein
MSGSEKVYVIDPDSLKSKANKLAAKSEYSNTPNGKDAQSKNGGFQDRVSLRSSSRRSPVSLIFSYLAGPISVLAPGRERRNRFWTGLALFSIILSIIVLVIWNRQGFWSANDHPAGVVLLSAAVMAVLSGFAAWTKAVLSAGRHEASRLRRAPGWMRGPLAAGFFGIVCPGMGLFVAGRVRQAAAALWMASLTVVSILVLSRAGWLWNFNLHAGIFSIERDTMEYVLIVAGVVAIIGALAWVGQVLNGIRFTSVGAGGIRNSRYNWPAAALLSSVIGLLIFSKPAPVAEALDQWAEATGAEGMRIIPLHLSLASIHLDPSRPDYVIRAIDLYEENDDPTAAELMRRDLVERMEASLPFLEEEGLVPSKGPESRAIQKIPAELISLDWRIYPSDQGNELPSDRNGRNP